MRRAVRYGYSYLNFDEPFLYELVPILANQFANVFPELKAQEGFVANAIMGEEGSFFTTLPSGMTMLNNYIHADPYKGSGIERYYTDEEFETLLSKFPMASHEKQWEHKRNVDNLHSSWLKKVVPGYMAFYLSDTKGFSLDLTWLIAAENGFTVDEDGFNKEMTAQKQRGKADATKEQSDWVQVRDDVKTEFIGYDFQEANAQVVKYRSVKQKDKELFQLVLDKNAFLC